MDFSPPSFFMLRFCLPWEFIDLLAYIILIIITVSSYVQLPCYVEKQNGFSVVSYYIWLLQSFYSSVCNPHWTWEGGKYHVNVPFIDEYSIALVLCPLTRCGSVCKSSSTFKETSVMTFERCTSMHVVMALVNILITAIYKKNSSNVSLSMSVSTPPLLFRLRHDYRKRRRIIVTAQDGR